MKDRVATEVTEVVMNSFELGRRTERNSIATEILRRLNAGRGDADQVRFLLFALEIVDRATYDSVKGLFANA